MKEKKAKRAADLVEEQQVTYDGYAALPDDGIRYEIIDGKLEAMSPSPSLSHQAIGGELRYILKSSCNSGSMPNMAWRNIGSSPP